MKSVSTKQLIFLFSAFYLFTFTLTLRFVATNRLSVFAPENFIQDSFDEVEDYRFKQPSANNTTTETPLNNTNNGSTNSNFDQKLNQTNANDQNANITEVMYTNVSVGTSGTIKED